MLYKKISPSQKAIANKLKSLSDYDAHSKQVFIKTLSLISTKTAKTNLEQRQILANIHLEARKPFLETFSHSIKNYAPIIIIVVVLSTGGLGFYFKKIQPSTSNTQNSSTATVEPNGTVENTVASITNDMTSELQLAQESLLQTENNIKAISNIAESISNTENVQNF